MIDLTKNIKNISVKKPDREDLADLAPLGVAILVWLFTSENKKSLLLPSLAALVAWLLVKGLTYVPR